MRQHLIQLHRILTDRFDVEDLRTLCSLYLDVPYDHLRGEGQPGKVTALLEHLDNRGRISDLVNAGRAMRPDIDWPEEEAARPEADAGDRGPGHRIEPARQRAEGDHIAQADRGGVAVVGDGNVVTQIEQQAGDEATQIGQAWNVKVIRYEEESPDSR